MGVKILGYLVKCAGWVFSVNHTASHGDAGVEDASQQLWLSGIAHCVNAALRESEVDGLCKVEGDNAGVSEVWASRQKLY